MTERNRYQPGVPCWIETWQPDADAAAGFYERLFGWETSGPAGGPFMCTLRGRDVAFIGERPPEHEHLPVAWKARRRSTARCSAGRRRRSARATTRRRCGASPATSAACPSSRSAATSSPEWRGHDDGTPVADRLLGRRRRRDGGTCRGDGRPGGRPRLRHADRQAGCPLGPAGRRLQRLEDHDRGLSDPVRRIPEHQAGAPTRQAGACASQGSSERLGRLASCTPAPWPTSRCSGSSARAREAASRAGGAGGRRPARRP